MTAKELPEDSSDPQFEHALRALQATAWADAASLFERYVVANPESAAAWGNLSIAYRGLGETARQLAAARSAYDPWRPRLSHCR